MNEKIAVLGAGNGGYAMAADLSMVGYEINLYEYPDYAENLSPIIKRRGIEILSRTPAGEELELPAGGKSGFVEIKGKITSDIQEAIKDIEIIMLVVPAFGREAFIKEFAPHLEDGQIIVIWPGYFGALQCAKLLKDMGINKKVSIAETESLIYNCTKLGEAKVYNKGNKEHLLVSFLSAIKKEEIFRKLNKIYPQLTLADNVLQTTLANGNPSLHPMSVLLNLYRVERKFYPFDEKLNKPVEKAYDVTPGMARVMEAVDMEKVAIGEKLGIKVPSIKTQIEAFYGAKGSNLYETLLNCYAYQVQGAPTSLEDRYVTEDVPFGLIPFALLGEQIGVSVDNLKAMATIGCSVTGKNFWNQGMNMEKAGLAGMTADEIRYFIS
jgi:opine dehydrogenase